jgi:uncharacterized peroxidase-related enzyme
LFGRVPRERQFGDESGRCRWGESEVKVIDGDMRLGFASFGGHLGTHRSSPQSSAVASAVMSEVSRFGVVELDGFPPDLRDRVGVIAEKSGFVPNIFRGLARRPAELRAFLDYHDALMDSDEGLSRAERELVVVATSGANHCSYCIVAHGAILRIRARDPQLADHVASNPWTAPLDRRQRAIVDLALVIATRSAELSEHDLHRARAAGLSEDEIWDVGAITALFAMSNRLAHLMALRPNDEFFTMGRAARGSQVQPDAGRSWGW